MIALLAAVAEETHLLRQDCPDLERIRLHGLEAWRGTWRETPICLAHSGVGKAAAAAAAATLLLGLQPTALCLFGCGGAYPDSGLEIGDLALADREIFADEGAETPDGFRSLAELQLPMRRDGEKTWFNTWPTDPRLTVWARQSLEAALPEPAKRLAVGPFATVSTCTGSLTGAQRQVARTSAICENMEGAAVALACRQTGTPFLELRGISNRVEDRNPAGWDLAAGMTTAQKAVAVLLDSWSEVRP